jgi:1-acyl-sn-glycerol-3-phosphate acyltransferase
LAIELRAAFRLARSVLHLLWCVAIVASLVPWMSTRCQLAFKARWSRQLLAVMGARIVASGPFPAHGLLVANHVSWLDVFAINAIAPTTFLSRDEVLRWPVIGWLCRRVGTLFLERGSRSAARRAKERLIDELRGGTLVGVFPEGKAGFGDHVMPFHAALFQSAIDAETVVIPALIRYTDRQGKPSLAAAYVGETSLWQCVRSIIKMSGLTAHVDFLPEITAAGADRRRLARHSHQIISHALAAAMPSRPVPPAECTAIGIPVDPQAVQP